MNKLKTAWENFKQKQNTTEVVGENPLQPALLLLDLHDHTAQLINALREDLKKSQGVHEIETGSKTAVLHQVLTTLAHVENYYDLPSSLIMSHETEMQNKLNVQEFHLDILEGQSDLLKACLEIDLFEIQYSLNHLLSTIVIFAHGYKVDLSEVLTSDINSEITTFKSELTQPMGNKFITEYDNRKAVIAEAQAVEAVLDLRLENGQITAVTLEYDGSGHIDIFSEGNLIKDFFRASSSVFNKRRDESMNILINYSPALREYLYKHRNKYSTGYLKDDKLVVATNLPRNSKDNTTVLVGGLPVILTKDLTTVEKFLDYITL